MTAFTSNTDTETTDESDNVTSEYPSEVFSADNLEKNQLINTE